jgi:hypothetical protein
LTPDFDNSESDEVISLGRLTQFQKAMASVITNISGNSTRPAQGVTRIGDYSPLTGRGRHALASFGADTL